MSRVSNVVATAANHKSIFSLGLDARSITSSDLLFNMFCKLWQIFHLLPNCRFHALLHLLYLPLILFNRSTWHFYSISAYEHTPLHAFLWSSNKTTPYRISFLQGRRKVDLEYGRIGLHHLWYLVSTYPIMKPIYMYTNCQNVSN